MAAWHKKVFEWWARTSMGDRISIMIALISLFVSATALGISWTVWKRPPPADPTLIPYFGQIGNSRTIDSGKNGDQFFAFLDKYAGRKIRIMAWVEEGKGVEVKQEKNQNTTIEILRHCKGCTSDVLIIEGKDTAGLSGLQWNSGHVLEGYFANYGRVSARMDVIHRAITPIDIVTAVS
jgi:hypothetical protein